MPPDGYEFVVAEPGERTCHWVSDSLFVYVDALSSGLRLVFHDFIPALLADVGISPCQLAPNAWRLVNCFIVLCLRKNIVPSIPLFRKIFQFKNSPSSSPGWVYINHRANHPHIFNTASIPENNSHWKFDFLKIVWEGGDWGTLFRKQFSRVSDGSADSIMLSEAERLAYDELVRDGGESLSWDLLEEFSLKAVGLSGASSKGINLICSLLLIFIFTVQVLILLCFHFQLPRR